MKPKIPLILLAILCAGVIGAVFGPQRVRWTWNDGRQVQWQGTSGSIVNFGLRDDGVVVWREVTTKTNAVIVTTNSPAERDDSGVMVLTNMIPYHDTKWTNGAWFQFLPMADITNGVYFP